MEQSRSTRERLLEAAAELFYRDGIDRTGVNAVVSRAGVARMSLYNLFGSKDELVAAYLRRRDDWWRGLFTAAVAAQTDPRERLLVVFEAYAARIPEEGFRGCAFINGAAEIADPDHPAFPVIRAHKDWVRDELARLAAQADTPAPAELAEQVFILVEGAIAVAGIRRDDEPLRRARAVAAHLVDEALADGRTTGR